MVTNPTFHSSSTINAPLKPFGLWVLLAVSIAVLATVFAIGASANPPNAAEMRIQGLVSVLQQDRLTAQRHAAQQQLESMGEEAVPALLVALRSDNPVLRRNASDMLGYIASPTAGAGLQYALANDLMPTVRRNAAYALGEMNRFSQVNDLQQAALLDTNALARQTAIDSLARVQSRIALSAGVNERDLTAYAVAPQGTDNLYAAVGRDLKVTADSGKTWQTLTGVLPSIANVLAVSPSDMLTIYAGVEGLGVFKSVDGGRVWTALNNGLTVAPGVRTAVSAITIDPMDAQHVLIATGVMLGTGKAEFVPTGIMSSTNGGIIWNRMREDKQGDALTQLLLKGNQVYALAGNQVKIYRFH